MLFWAKKISAAITTPMMRALPHRIISVSMRHQSLESDLESDLESAYRGGRRGCASGTASHSGAADVHRREFAMRVGFARACPVLYK